jgi:hypothetical protein
MAVGNAFEYHYVFRNREAARKATRALEDQGYRVELFQDGRELHVRGDLPGEAIRAFASADSDSEAEADLSRAMEPVWAAIDDLLFRYGGRWTGEASWVAESLPSLRDG